MTLVQIPWQPYYWLHPDTLKLLKAASARRGHNLYLYTGDRRGLLSAWRSWVQQNVLYQAALRGGVSASSPNTGQRSHMRGAAFDLRDTDTATQAACRAAGLIRDPQEPWHWNHPAWASMPIIPTNTQTVSINTALLTMKEDETMRLYYVQNSSTRDYYTFDGYTFQPVGNTGTPTDLMTRIRKLLASRKLTRVEMESLAAQGAKHLNAIRPA